MTGKEGGRRGGRRGQSGGRWGRNYGRTEPHSPRDPQSLSSGKPEVPAAAGSRRVCRRLGASHGSSASPGSRREAVQPRGASRRGTCPALGARGGRSAQERPGRAARPRGCAQRRWNARPPGTAPGKPGPPAAAAPPRPAPPPPPRPRIPLPPPRPPWLSLRPRTPCVQPRAISSAVGAPLSLPSEMARSRVLMGPGELASEDSTLRSSRPSSHTGQCDCASSCNLCDALGTGTRVPSWCWKAIGESRTTKKDQDQNLAFRNIALAQCGEQTEEQSGGYDTPKRKLVKTSEGGDCENEERQWLSYAGCRIERQASPRKSPAFWMGS
ncbi:uncharacterized protein LOC125101143 [Lutra lutra]|uniref:uncharacterized protein LOC125101143 n=1 Tax=Lutra lutra TaxID=9657 RepID=UPI001FD45243|nr:uncharacterized protein LOC125101143 [Lutra lutra]